MKRGLLIYIAIAVIVMMVSGCSVRQATSWQESKKPVKVMEVREEVYPVCLEYTGTVDAKEFKKYSFKTPGIVGRIFITEGADIRKGDVLASLDSKETELAVQAAFNNMEKARRAYEFSRDNFDKMETLLTAGAVSRQDVDRAKLELDSNEVSYHNARLDYENKQKLLEDTTIKADLDGYVAGIYFKEGEMAGAGYPVVAVRSSELVVRVGITQQDFDKITLNTLAQITVNGRENAGKVTDIDYLPDSQTRTYQIEISMENNNAPLGAVARVVLLAGEKKGVLIPITTILKSDRDFVFVVAGDRAEKRNITLGEVRGTNVWVYGLREGEKLVVEGMKRLEDGDMVEIQED